MKKKQQKSGVFGAVMKSFSAWSSSPQQPQQQSVGAYASYSRSGYYSSGGPSTARQRFNLVAENPTAREVVEYISNAAASVPLAPKDSNGNLTFDGENPLVRLLNTMDAEYGGRHNTVKMIAMSLLIEGNAYLSTIDSTQSIQIGNNPAKPANLSERVRGRRPRGNTQREPRRTSVPQMVRFLEPTYVTTETATNDNTITHYHYSGRNKNEILTPEQVIHFKSTWPWDRNCGFSPVDTVWRKIQALNMINEIQRQILENGALPPAIVYLDEQKDSLVTDDQFFEIGDTIKRWRREGARTGDPVFLRGKYGMLELPRVMDMISLEQQESLEADVCNGFGFPAILLNSAQGATFENQREARITLWEQTIIPRILEPIVNTLSAYIGAPIGYDLSESPIAQAQSNNMWKRQQEAREILTMNERRELVDMETIEAASGDHVIRSRSDVAYDLDGNEVNQADQAELVQTRDEEIELALSEYLQKHSGTVSHCHH